MVKKIWLIIVSLFIFSEFIIQALPRNEYPAVQVAFIPSGEAEQEVKCFVDVKGAIGHISPTTYAIGKDEKIYIGDDLKKRIAVYDLEGNYIRQINSDKVYIGNLYAIKVDKNGNIFCLTNVEDLFIKLNANGDLIYKKDEKYVPNIYEGFFPYNDYLFYYDKKHKIKCLNPQGENMSDEEINNLLESIKAQEEKTSGVRSIASIQPQLDNFLKKQSLIFIDGILYSKQMSDYNKLWDTVGSNAEIKGLKETYRKKEMLESDNRLAKTNLTKGAIITPENMKEYTRYGGIFIGIDKDGNSLWDGSGIVVMDKYYNVIDAFKVTGAKISYPLQVAPNGDFYFWQRTRDGITFYKVVRRW